MATLTMVTSSSAMNWPAISTASMSQRRRSAAAGSPPAGAMDVAVMPRVCVAPQTVTRSPLILVLPAPGTTVGDAAHWAHDHPRRATHDPAGGDRRQRRGPRRAPHRAGRLPARPPHPHQPRGHGPAARVAAADPRAAPRGGGAARRDRRDLVHLARAGPADPRQRAGPGRGRPHAAAGPGGGRAPVPARRRPGGALRGGQRDRVAGAAGDPRLARSGAGDADQRPLRPAGQQPGAAGPLLPGARGVVPAPQRPVVLLHRAGGTAALRQLRRGGAPHGGDPAGVVRAAPQRARLDRLRPTAQRRQPRLRADVEAPRRGQPRVADQALPAPPGGAAAAAVHQPGGRRHAGGADRGVHARGRRDPRPPAADPPIAWARPGGASALAPTPREGSSGPSPTAGTTTTGSDPTGGHGAASGGSGRCQATSKWRTVTSRSTRNRSSSG